MNCNYGMCWSKILYCKKWYELRWYIILLKCLVALKCNDFCFKQCQKIIISNQDINRLITEKYPGLPPYLSKYPPGYKLLLKDAHDTNST